MLPGIKGPNCLNSIACGCVLLASVHKKYLAMTRPLGLINTGMPKSARFRLFERFCAKFLSFGTHVAVWKVKWSGCLPNEWLCRDQQDSE
jgi:hypothetical protein